METKNNQQIKAPALELKQLEIFKGKWKIDGKNFPIAPSGGEAPIHGEDNYTWLKGNFYLVNNWKHLFDDGGHQGISILGFDDELSKLFTKNFDNFGIERKYILENENGKWKFNGDKERATREFSKDGKSYIEHWEMKNNEGKWTPLCLMNGTKEQENN